ncbi:hypothetical protein D082_02700 [Synechocystis sp. PCC 6714]|nr:hypothetical protein D082_02700 [Synechocystis sp. PCC 6714]
MALFYHWLSNNNPESMKVQIMAFSLCQLFVPKYSGARDGQG